jgi:HAD superfamily hydrolase (TIGR01549 family)
VKKGKNKQLIKGVVFDLDDTLYDEKQYIKSGFKVIAEYLGIADAQEQMWKYFEAGEPAIDKYLQTIGQTNKKAKCLELYREHTPDLSLNNGIKELLDELKRRGIKIGIITDGRTNGQKKKISSLCLDQIMDDIIVTDELGGEQFRKPCDIAFRIIQRRWAIPFEQIAYIGDNVAKDFQAPKQLGMQWFLLDNPNSLYYTSNAEALKISDIANEIL